MGSSKIWRKGRWFWICTEENSANVWEDSWACGATSRLTYTTREEADIASTRHVTKKGHKVVVGMVRGKR